MTRVHRRDATDLGVKPAGLGAPFNLFGLALLVAGIVAIPAIAWRIFTLWGAGTLAAKTNAAEA